MLRVVMAGLVGGVVLMAWSAVFAAVGPMRSGAAPDSALASVIHEQFGDLRGAVPLLGPAQASAASVPQAERAQATGPALAAAPLDPVAMAQGMGVACLAGVFAAMLMARAGGKSAAFAERVVVAVLLGVFASGAMLVAGGRWAEFSPASAAPLIGEVVVGWLLAGMVIAVMLRPVPRRAKA